LIHFYKRKMEPPDFNSIFRGFFGFNNARKNLPYDNRESPDDDVRAERPNSNNFQVFTDPSEIHRFFEHQMEEMFREFKGIGDILDRNVFLEDWSNPARSRGIIQEDEFTDRDMMLKHDDYSSRVRKQDQDFDDKKLTAEDLSELFKARTESDDNDKPMNDIIRKGFDDIPMTRKFDCVPHESDEGSIRTFSYSRSMKTVRRPDGSIEVEERTSNPDGSETVTIRRSVDGSTNEFASVFQDPGELFSGKFGLRFGPPTFQLPKNEQGPESETPEGPVADKKYASIFSKFFGSLS